MNHEPTHLDLFTGLAGFALAAQAAGFRTIGFCEIDPWCCRLLAERFPGVPNFGDIRTANFAGLPPVDLCSGGTPCQPASQAGKRRGTQDDRWLWPAALAVVELLHPKWIVFENVPGLITLNGGMELDRVLSNLEAQGYTTGTLVIPACAVDARHRRDRVWIVARATFEGHREHKDRQRKPPEGWAAPGPRGETLANDIRARLEIEPCQPGDNGSECPTAERGCEQRPGRESKSRVGQLAHGLSAPLDGTCLWPDEDPEVPRVATGVKERVARLKGLGNAIVPAVAFQILRHIRNLIEP